MKPTNAILPADATQAVEKMIELTRDMKDIMESEARVLNGRDPDELQVLLDRKDEFSRTYEAAGAEFHARAAEFKAVMPALLHELKSEQEALQRQAHANGGFYKAARKLRGGN